MKCNYCGKSISKGNNFAMKAQGEVIANYCSKDCRSKVASQMIGSLEESGREDKPEIKTMTYFEAISIQQDLLVNMQYSGAFKKQPVEALKETAAKYTTEQFAQALCAIEQQLRKDYEDTRKLFALAMASMKMETGGN